MFASRLRALREKAGLSQEQLAAELGFSQNQITRWETGKWTPQADALVVVAKVFNVSVDYLLGVRDDSSYPVDSLTDEEREIIELLRRQRKQQSEAKS